MQILYLVYSHPGSSCWHLFRGRKCQIAGSQPTTSRCGTVDRQTLTKGTKSANARVWKVWLDFHAQGVCAGSLFPVDSAYIVLYVVARHRKGIKATLIQQELSAILYIHQLWGAQDTCKSFLVTAVNKRERQVSSVPLQGLYWMVFGRC